MSEISNKFVVVTLTNVEAKVWVTGIDKGSKPELIQVPERDKHLHIKNGPNDHLDKNDATLTLKFYEEISQTIASASDILLIGHGKGKASSMVRFIQYLERKHPELGKKVVDALDEDLSALSEPQILALALDWFESHPH
jgi:hypothetical protein